MKFLAFAVLGAAVASAAHAADSGLPRPTPHMVDARTVVPRDCLSLHLKGARVLMARADLDALAMHRGRPYRDEQERQAMIAGSRASELLGAATMARDASDCLLIDGDRLGQDPLFVVGDLLGKGQAMILRDGKAAPELRIAIRDFGDGPAGYRSYECLDGSAILVLMLWIS